MSIEKPREFVMVLVGRTSEWAVWCGDDFCIKEFDTAQGAATVYARGLNLAIEQRLEELEPKAPLAPQTQEPSLTVDAILTALGKARTLAVLAYPGDTHHLSAVVFALSMVEGQLMPALEAQVTP